MSDKVLLKNDGNLYKRYWDSKAEENFEEIINGTEVFSVLRSSLEIEDGTTFGQLIQWVRDNEYIKTFISQYSWSSKIDLHLNQIDEEYESVDEDKKTKIEKLVVRPIGEVHEWEGVNDLEVWYDFAGVGQVLESVKEDGEIVEKWFDTSISVSLCSLSELKNYEIAIDNEIVLFDYRDIKSDRKLLSANKDITLLDFLDAIFWDISFHGNPESKKEFLDNLKETSEEIQRAIEEGRLDDMTIPLDDLFDELKGIASEEDEGIVPFENKKEETEDDR